MDTLPVQSFFICFKAVVSLTHFFHLETCDVGWDPGNRKQGYWSQHNFTYLPAVSSLCLNANEVTAGDVFVYTLATGVFTV